LTCGETDGILAPHASLRFSRLLLPVRLRRMTLVLPMVCSSARPNRPRMVFLAWAIDGACSRPTRRASGLHSLGQLRVLKFRLQCPEDQGDLCHEVGTISSRFLDRVDGQEQKVIVGEPTVRSATHPSLDGRLCIPKSTYSGADDRSGVTIETAHDYTIRYPAGAAALSGMVLCMTSVLALGSLGSLCGATGRACRSPRMFPHWIQLTY
jgi:hypothetical protein